MLSNNFINSKKIPCLEQYYKVLYCINNGLGNEEDIQDKCYNINETYLKCINSTKSELTKKK
jgi:hypothetical protein